MTTDASDLSRIARLIGDPTRARMLCVLMDGRAYTATELAAAGEVGASTASAHLERLVREGALAVVRQGRHRYFRIAGPQVAGVLETLATLPVDDAIAPACGPADAALRRARVCYDHLAGELGVALLRHLLRIDVLDVAEGELAPTAHGRVWLGSIGIDAATLRRGRRPLCRMCVDWSERRDHLGGALGAALLDALLARRCLRRRLHTRALAVTPAGEIFFRELAHRRVREGALRSA